MTLALYHSGYVFPGVSKAAPLIMFLDASVIRDTKAIDQNTDYSSRTDKVET